MAGGPQVAANYLESMQTAGVVFEGGSDFACGFASCVAGLARRARATEELSTGVAAQASSVHGIGRCAR